MACQSTFKFLRRWAKRIIFSYILFALLFTCPLITLESDKDVDFYICRTGEGIHDLMLDSPLYPLWTKVIDPSVEVIRKKAYPIMKKASKRFGKKIKPLMEKTSAEGQVYLQAAHEKVLELHELHLAPTVQKIQTESDKIYKQYKPTLDKHASNIHSVYTQNVKPHLDKHSSTLCELIKSNTPKPIYEKFEYMDYFFKNELNLGTSTIPAKVHGFFKYQFLPVLYLKVNNLAGEIKNFYEPHEKKFHDSPVGSFYKEKTTAFNTMREDPESLFHKLTTKLYHFYDTTSTILYEKVDEFLSDPADLETEENIASAFFHKSQQNPSSEKTTKEFAKETESIKKTAETAASAASESLESVASSALPKVTKSVKKAAAKATDTLSESAESAASVASETLASVTGKVLSKATPSIKKAASKATDALSESAESAASVASETLASVGNKALPKETPDLKKKAFKAASDLSDNAKSAGSAASESLESVASSVLPKATPSAKKAAAKATDALSDGAKSAGSAASETLASVTSKVLPKETPNMKKAASKAASGLSESAKSAASVASETLESVTSSALPKETPDAKKVAAKAADVLSESAESVASKLKPGSKDDKIQKPKIAVKKTSKNGKANKVDIKPDIAEKPDKVKVEGTKAKKSVKTTISEETVQKDSNKDEL